VGQVTVRVNGYAHTIGCKDGEEQHVLDLVQQIEDKVRVIRAMGGQLSEARMLLHVSLLLADEASDLRSEIARVRSGGGGALAAAPVLATAAPAAAAADPELAERLTRIAERIEGLAQAMDRE
jgi:cell division protein ZapA